MSLDIKKEEMKRYERLCFLFTGKKKKKINTSINVMKVLTEISFHLVDRNLLCPVCKCNNRFKRIFCIFIYVVLQS